MMRSMQGTVPGLEPGPMTRGAPGAGPSTSTLAQLLHHPVQLGAVQPDYTAAAAATSELCVSRGWHGFHGWC